MSTVSSLPVVDGPAEVQLRQIPLSRIVIPDGFNPRGEVQDDRELEQLADSIRRHGVLQPVRVRATDHGDYLLIAGERRYRAAVKAALMQLPAIIRPAGAGDEDEQAMLLAEAVIENDQRSDLDPTARALGYQRLLDSGLTVKGVAEQLGTTHARVRDHLRILKLPEPLQAGIAAGEVPLRAVKQLAELAKIHPGLAETAALHVLQPDENYEPYTWADVEHDPLTVAIHSDLPDGVYAAHTAYPLTAFEPTEPARKDLEAIQKLTGRPVADIVFRAEEVAQARALGAAFGENWQTIIVGADVANQLAADQLARRLKEHRARVRRERELHRQQPNGSTPPGSGDHVVAPGGDAVEASEEEARRVRREADREARERAIAFNLELGRTVYAELSRVKVDERALKILASIDLTGKLGEVAVRGARYGFPGWVGEETQRNGKTKHVYVEQREEAARRASEYLAGARTAGEIAGRQLALIAMATYADQNAVAMSNRSWHHIQCEGPWADQVGELLDDLAADKLPDSTLALLKPMLEDRQRERDELAALRQGRAEALARLEGAEERMPELAGEELEQVKRDLEAAWTGWDDRQSHLRQLVRKRENELTTDTDPDTETPVGHAA